VEFDWRGQDELFVNLLRLRNVEMVLALGGGSIPPRLDNLGVLEIGDIAWWLEWMLEASNDNSSHWFLSTLSSILANHVSDAKIADFVAEFNKNDSKYRRVLLDYVIPAFDIPFDSFSEDTISFLLADLSRRAHISEWHGHLLGRTATEKFVSERLLPLLDGARGQFVENLKSVLKQAGSRHGRRYIGV
jgi:hypothetical protein